MDETDPQGLPSVTTWKVMGRCERHHLARHGTGHRAYPPAARSQRGHGLADRRRQYLWLGAALRRPILHLLAREVTIPISKNKSPIVVTAPVPPHMKERLSLCGWKEETSKQKLPVFSPSCRHLSLASVAFDEKKVWRAGISPAKTCRFLSRDQCSAVMRRDEPRARFLPARRRRRTAPG